MGCMQCASFTRIFGLLFNYPRLPFDTIYLFFIWVYGFKFINNRMCIIINVFKIGVVIELMKILIHGSTVQSRS